MSARSYDFCILGAGIAGLSLAESLKSNGVSAAVLEKRNVASGASGTPLGMINIATGRRATKTWRAELCYQTVNSLLEKAEPYTDRTYYAVNGILRPALTAKIALNMREQFEKTTWREGWCEWLTEQEIKDRHPGINCVGGGIWSPVGITVKVEAYLKAVARYLEDDNVQIITNTGTIEFKNLNSGWEISTEDKLIFARNLVFATGYDTLSNRFWKDLPLHPIKGQLAVFEVDEPLKFEHSISSLGYLAHLNDHEFIQGSTYEHDFETLEPDTNGERYLRKRLRKTLPELENKARLKEQWAGVRISTPNRKPVIGAHKDKENLFIFTGLGSKGLLYGKYVADHFAEHLVNGKPLLKALDVNRFY